MRPKRILWNTSMGFKRVFAVLLLSALPQCASIGPSEEAGLSFSDGDEETLVPVPFEPKSGMAGFSMGAAKHQVRWIVCNHQAPKGAAVVLQGELPDFQNPSSCNEPLAQAFLYRDLSVVLVARPGAMGSSGQNDLGGPLTLAGTIAAVKSVLALPTPELKGKLTVMWGYGSGAGVAALASRQIGGIATLILGGGYYDYELLLSQTQSPSLKGAIQKIKTMTGDKGIEFRSVSYDIASLPKNILIYHGSQDRVALLSQARSFADSLRASGEHLVTFKVLENEGHWLSPLKHQHATVSLLKGSEGQKKP